MARSFGAGGLQLQLGPINAEDLKSRSVFGLNRAMITKVFAVSPCVCSACCKKKTYHPIPLGLWGIMSLKLYPSQHIRHWNSEALNSLITPLSTTTQSPLRTIGPYDTGAGDPEWPVELMQGRAIGLDRCFTLSLWISTFGYLHIEI